MRCKRPIPSTDSHEADGTTAVVHELALQALVATTSKLTKVLSRKELGVVGLRWGAGGRTAGGVAIIVYESVSDRDSGTLTDGPG